MILGLQFKDTQCGFKAFTRRAAQTILPLQRIERWGFDPEILFLARKFGFRVDEVPVRWGHSGDTRIHPLIDGARMFQEMLRVRWYDMTGKYDGHPVVVATTGQDAAGATGAPGLSFPLGRFLFRVRRLYRIDYVAPHVRCCDRLLPAPRRSAVREP